MTRRYVDVAAVAERYGVSGWTVYEWARTNRVPHRKRGGRLMFLEAELDAFDDGAQLEVRKLPRGDRVVVPVAPAATRRLRSVGGER